ncbi:MAG: nucleotide exchange factor GrpE [Candidatus Hinthialibacter sp.]
MRKKTTKTALNPEAMQEDRSIQGDAGPDESAEKPDLPEEIEDNGLAEEAAPASETPPESEAASGAEEQITVNTAEYQKICSERDEFLNHLQRLQAEFENYRKRVLKEKSELRDYLIQDFISSLLNVIDNMERSLHPDYNTNDVVSYRQGVEMVFNQMLSILEEKGLTRIESVGQKFDPRIHEAIRQEETESCEPGIITAEFMPGYMIKDRILRAPKVVVAVKPSGPQTEEVQTNEAAAVKEESQKKEEIQSQQTDEN